MALSVFEPVMTSWFYEALTRWVPPNTYCSIGELQSSNVRVAAWRAQINVLARSCYCRSSWVQAVANRSLK